MDDSGAHHFSYSKLDYAQEDADYKEAALRSDSGFGLKDSSVIESVDEYGDGISVQILTVFPSMVLQQIRNTIAVRVLRPRGVDECELEWIHLGFDTDDEAMTERRLRQGNLIGAAGYISMEDGCVGGFVQRALQYNDEGAGLVMMPRGLGSFAAMFVVGRLVGRVDTRLILVTGLGLCAIALLQMTHFDLSMDARPFVTSGIVQGLGIGGQDPADLDGIFKVRYQGCRYAFGYPACPNLEDRAKVMRLLQPERIGVTLSEEFQLAPEQSTDALIVHHPEAKYFST